MYGYLRLINSITPPSIQRHYRSCYCTLCHALWNNYGMRPRFILSFDMTFLAVMLDLEKQVNIDETLLCYKKHTFSETESWKRLSAMSILLAAKKLEDNINDDNDLKAKLFLRIFNRAIRKAEADYPDVAELFTCGFREMSVMEKESKDVFALSHKFGDIMTGAVSALFTCDTQDIVVMHHVTEWVYFIDAIDDLDADYKDGSYNPFKKYASTRENLLSQRSDYIKSFITKQMEDLKPVLSLYSEGSPKNWIVMSTLTDTLTLVTERVLKGEKPYKRTSILTQLLQTRGGYRLA